MNSFLCACRVPMFLGAPMEVRLLSYPIWKRRHLFSGLMAVAGGNNVSNEYEIDLQRRLSNPGI
ncbi:hypothetical protein [Halobacillus litoralis]|uniref:hypothetical protein n=1 Tax=Halobacillus litoralis TaxID=45668 RepID=UPI001CD3A7F5|nr:hypothetical protein [Halobacillus litoralis]MCA1022496.1 hypothetical protein [Halobacillus litoralis]